MASWTSQATIGRAADTTSGTLVHRYITKTNVRGMT